MESNKETLLSLLDPPFPLVYPGILPSEQHFQMTRSRLSRECSVCERVTTVFFWKYNNIPFKTCICQICAKSANVCQVSLLDLDLGIPVVVRNKLLNIQNENYTSKVRRWLNNRSIDRLIERGEEWIDHTIKEQIRHLDPNLVSIAKDLTSEDPYLTYNKAQVCQEWLAGNCIYGSSCYYSHELPEPGEISPDYTKHGVRGRYLGTIDPNGQKIVEKLAIIMKQREPDLEKKPEIEKTEPIEQIKSETKIAVFKSLTIPPKNEDPPSKPTKYQFKATNKTFPKFVDGVFIR